MLLLLTNVTLSISGGASYVKANRFRNMPYIPIPVIDPHLVLPLGQGIMHFGNDGDNELPSIDYGSLDLDLDGIVRTPVALAMLEHVECVPVPLVYHYLRKPSIRLFHFDPAPTRRDEWCLLFIAFTYTFSAVFAPEEIRYWKRWYEDRRRRSEYWRNHRSNLYPLFYRLVGPRYGTRFWAEHRHLAAPRRPDFPAPYREPRTWWGKLVEFFTPETIPPIPREDCEYRLPYTTLLSLTRPL